jgi:acetyl esterase
MPRMSAPPPIARVRMQMTAARALAALPERAQLALSGRPPVQLDGQRLDPGVQLLLRAMQISGEATLVSDPGVDPGTVREQARQGIAAVRHPTAVGAVSELMVDGGGGMLRARHYAPPDAAGRLPLVVFIHGGGWVIGDLDTHDEACRIICRHGGVHVLAIDYRLAPEHPFPAALEDSLAATRWALARAGELGADERRVAVAGDSAGGNLAAVVSRQLAREGNGEPALQALIYPGTDFVARTRSHELFAEGFFLDQQSMDWFKARYIPDGADTSDPRLSPLRAPDLDALPPALVVTAAFDPLRDEGEAYARALHEAGNRVVVHRFPGLIHGFINFTAVNRASRLATIALAGMICGALPKR